MKAFLFALLVVSALTVDASSSEKNQRKRGLYQPQQLGSLHANDLTTLVHGHNLDLGHGYHGGIHGGFAHGDGLLLGGQSNGLGLGYANGFGYNHHENVVNHVVRVPVPVAQPVAVHRDVPVAVPHLVPVVVKRPVKIPVPQPVPVVVEKPYHVPVNRPVPTYVPTPVHVPHPVPVPIAVPEFTQQHLPSVHAPAVPLVHSHIPFKSDFGSHGFDHGSSVSVGQFGGNLGGHGGSQLVSLPSRSYGYPVGKVYHTAFPSSSYGAPSPSYGAPSPSYSVASPSYSAPSPSYGTPSADFSNNHASASFESSLSVASSSSGSNGGYDYPVPSKKFI